MLIGLTSMLWGCYPGGPTSYDEYDLVYTNHQADYTFKGKGKYTMPDKIVLIDASWMPGTSNNFVNATYATIALNTIKANMAALGYSYVNTIDSAQADFTVLPGAIQTENYNYSYWYDYYGWYYPGGGYGWYYPYPVVTSYTSGSLVLAMIDRKELSATNKNPIVWTSIINGVLEGASSTLGSRIAFNINQAYAQSQYLQQ